MFVKIVKIAEELAEKKFLQNKNGQKTKLKVLNTAWFFIGSDVLNGLRIISISIKVILLFKIKASSSQPNEAFVILLFLNRFRQHLAS